MRLSRLHIPKPLQDVDLVGWARFCAHQMRCDIAREYEVYHRVGTTPCPPYELPKPLQDADLVGWARFCAHQIRNDMAREYGVYHRVGTTPSPPYKLGYKTE